MCVPRYILLVIILCSLCTFTYPNELENQSIRRVKRGEKEQNETIAMLERHKKLARVFNALYLQMELADNKIDDYDVLAGIWKLKDRTVMDELFSLNVDKVSESLWALNSTINDVPDPALVMRHIESFEETKKSLSEITPNMREPLSDSTHSDALTRLITNSNQIANAMLEENLARAVKSTLSRLGDEETASYRNFELAMISESLKEIISFLKSVTVVVPEVFEKIQPGNQSAFLSGFKVALALKGKSSTLDIFSSQLISTDTDIAKLRRLENLTVTSEVKNDLIQFKSVLELFQSDFPTIASSFDSIQDALKIVDDVNDDWLTNVISGNNNSREADIRIQRFKLTSEKLKIAEPFDKPLKDSSHLKSVELLLRFLDKIQKFKGYTVDSQILHDSICYQTPTNDEPIPFDVLNSLEHSFQEFLEAARIIQRRFGYLKLTNFYSSIQSQYNRHFGSLDDASNERRKKSDRYEELEELLQELVPLCDAFLIGRNLEKAFKPLKENLPKINSTIHWLAEFKQNSKECDFLFSYDPNAYKSVKALLKPLSRIISEGTIQGTKSLMDVIPEAAINLKQFRDMSKLDTPSINQTRQLVIGDRENLLIFSSAVYHLEQALNIDKLSEQFEYLLDRKDQILVEINKTANATRREKLKRIWKDWPDLKVKLKKFRQANAKLLRLVRNRPEKDLAGIGEMYYHMSAAKFHGSFELKKYRESLSLLDEPIPEFENALELLEGPLSLNWNLAYRNFARMKITMRELKKDFDCYFDEKLCPKEEPIREYPTFEKPKSDIGNQLLWLIIHSLLSYVPPCLCLCLYFWCLGLFKSDRPVEEEEDTTTAKEGPATTTATTTTAAE